MFGTLAEKRRTGLVIVAQMMFWKVSIKNLKLACSLR
jgi:hypothetical protein